jgi:predicted dehydrogenase
MMDVGIHMTDLARWMAGDVTEAYGVASENVWHVEGSEDRALAVLKTASGAPINTARAGTSGRATAGSRLTATAA